MAYSNRVMSYTRPAAADLRTKQYFIVRNAGVQVNVASHAAAAFAVGAIGVLQNKPRGAGHAATVADTGISKVHGGAAVADGVLITTDNQGRGVAATSGDLVVGRCVLAITAAGQIMSARLNPVWRLNGAV